jgi:transcriptional regulator with XRE-family HTH domain
MVNMQTPTKHLGDEIRGARERLGLSTQVAAERAQISTGYLNKLETGQVGSPSPRVLHRVASVLEIDYWTLMRLAEYVTPDYNGAGERMPDLPPTGPAPTNAHIVELLETVLGELRELRGDLARA